MFSLGMRYNGAMQEFALRNPPNIKPPRQIQGKHVRLIPATRADRLAIYEGGATSDIASVLFDGNEPDWKDFDEFCKDYAPCYFDDSNSEGGRCFMIETVNGKRQVIGQVNYNPINRAKNRVDLDIWLFSEQHCDKGYGTEGLRLLCDYLHRRLRVANFLIVPSAANQRAIRAYAKAGFQPTTLKPQQAVAEYGEGEYEKVIYMTMHKQPGR